MTACQRLIKACGQTEIKNNSRTWIRYQNVYLCARNLIHLTVYIKEYRNKSLRIASRQQSKRFNRMYQRPQDYICIRTCYRCVSKSKPYQFASKIKIYQCLLKGHTGEHGYRNVGYRKIYQRLHSQSARLVQYLSKSTSMNDYIKSYVGFIYMYIHQRSRSTPQRVLRYWNIYQRVRSVTFIKEYIIEHCCDVGVQI